MKTASKLLTISFVLVLSSAWANAQTCNFVTAGTTMTLTNDCTTSSTITIPDGVTLLGNYHTITAVNPSGDQFRGPVLTNAAGATHAFVRMLCWTHPISAFP